MQSWKRFWIERLSLKYLTPDELIALAYSHKIFIARVAALEYVDDAVDEMDYEEARNMLKCLNSTQPETRLWAAHDAVIKSLNRHLDELNDEEFEYIIEHRRQNYSYQRQSFFSYR